LQVRQVAVQCVAGRVRNGLQQRPGHLGTNDRGGLERTLVLYRSWMVLPAPALSRLSPTAPDALRSDQLQWREGSAHGRWRSRSSSVGPDPGFPPCVNTRCP
jgi:hypothetical protein